MISVVIADDHDLIRSGFAGLIRAEDDIHLIGEARDAAELSALLRTVRPHVIVLDISLPDRNGLDVIRDIRERTPKARILVLSMHPISRYAHRAIADGACGYLTKDTAAEELVTAIRSVHGSGRYISRELAQELAQDTLHGRDHALHTTLSDREYELLIMIGTGYKPREIAEKMHVSINTVNSYRRRLLQKMNYRSNTDLVRYVLENELAE